MEVHYALSNEPKMNIVRCPQPLPPKGGSKTQNVQNLNNCNSLETVLITNRKLHTGLRLVPTSMTLNGVIAFILRFFRGIR